MAEANEIDSRSSHAYRGDGAALLAGKESANKKISSFFQSSSVVPTPSTTTGALLTDQSAADELLPCVPSRASSEVNSSSEAKTGISVVRQKKRPNRESESSPLWENTKDQNAGVMGPARKRREKDPFKVAQSDGMRQKKRRIIAEDSGESEEEKEEGIARPAVQQRSAHTARPTTAESELGGSETYDEAPSGEADELWDSDEAAADLEKQKDASNSFFTAIDW
mmetsp:Transcript_28258/g.72095  ORF Transcript_28258/g.72095 Transcript_28258/m.72095 type:complete len:224 (-) Transcript_28258:868-1539(-)